MKTYMWVTVDMLLDIAAGKHDGLVLACTS